MEFPDMPEQQLKRIKEAVIALIDTKFFTMRGGKISFIIRDGFVIKREISIVENIRA